MALHANTPHFSGEFAENIEKEQKVQPGADVLRTQKDVQTYSEQKVQNIQLLIAKMDVDEQEILKNESEDNLRSLLVNSSYINNDKIQQDDVNEFAKRNEDIYAKQIDSSTKEFSQKIWQNKEEAEKNIPKLQTALAPWATATDTLGITGFAQQYNHPNTTPEERAGMKTALMQNGLTAAEVTRFIEAVNSQLGIAHMKKVQEFEIVDAVIEKSKKEGADVLQKFLENMQTDQPITDEEFHELLQRNIQEFAEDDPIFRQLLQRQQTENQVILLMQQKIDVAAQPTEASTQLSDADTQARYEKLPEPVKQAMTRLVAQGGAPILTPMLQNNMQPSDNGYIAQVSGVDVELHTQDGALYIVGEHAKENLVNRSEYKIDPPTAAGFDETYIRMIVDQNGIASLHEPGMRQVLLGLAGKFGEDAENNTIMQADEANRFHNAMEIFFGADDIQASEEMNRLAELGIIGSTVEGGQGFRVNTQRTDSIHRAMAEYIPRSIDARRAHAPQQIQYKHFAALAALWNYTGNDTILPTQNDLVQLTNSLPEDTTQRNQALQRYCEEHGYIIH